MRLSSLPKSAGIYRIICLETGVSYVGSTNNFYLRAYGHQCRLRGDRHGNVHLQRVWNKYGEGNFTFEILERIKNYTGEFLAKREWYWVRKLGGLESLFNMAIPGESPTLGRQLSEETKCKISRALTGRKLKPYHIKAITEANTGRIVTEEHRRKLSLALKGRTISQTAREKLRQAHLGKKPTVKTRKKMSKFQSEYASTEKGRAQKAKAGHASWATEELREKHIARVSKEYPAFIHKDTGEIIPMGKNLGAMCRERGLDPAHMGRVARKVPKFKSHKGWKLLE